MMKPLLFLFTLSMGVHVTADSIIHVHNQSRHAVVAIWQAGGCMDIYGDPDGGVQYTTCMYEKIKAGSKRGFIFSALMFDRSVKVWHDNGGKRIGYCNSYDHETLTVTGDTREDQKVTGC